MSKIKQSQTGHAIHGMAKQQRRLFPFIVNCALLNLFYLFVTIFFRVKIWII